MSLSRRAVLMGCLALAACDVMKVDPKAEAVAKQAFQRLRAGDDAGFQALMEPSQRAPASAAMLAGLRGMIPPEPTPEPALSSWRTTAGTGGTQATLEHIYDFGDRAVRVRTLLVPAAGPDGWMVRGFNLDIGERAPPPPAPKGRAPGIQT